MTSKRLFFIEDKNWSTLIYKLEHTLINISKNKVCGNLLKPKNSTNSGIRIVIYSTRQNLEKKIRKAITLLKTESPQKFFLKEKIFITDSNFTPGKTLFLFPGFGSEFPSMLNGVLGNFDFIEYWTDILKELIFHNKNETPQNSNWVEEQLILKKFGVSESGPIGSITSLIFNEILKKLNVNCDAILGHSNGENTALISSGLFSYGSRNNLIDILKLLSNFPEQIDKEGKYLILSNFSKKDLEHLMQAFPDKVCLAMNNCPGQQVIFVTEDIQDKAVKFIKKRFGLAFELYTDYPYHTQFFKPLLDYLKPLYSRFEIKKVHIPVYSCVNSSLFPPERNNILDLALKQWVETVDFKKTIETAYHDGFRTFIEVGPNNKLSGFVANTLKGKNVLITHCSKEGIPVLDSLAEMCAQLWVNHHQVDLSYFIPNQNNVKTESATLNNITKEKIYIAHQELMKNFISTNQKITESFLRIKNFSNKKETSQQFKIEKRHELLLNGSLKKSEDKVEFQGVLDIRQHLLIKDHSMGGVLPVLPFTMSLELLAEIAREFNDIENENLIIYNVNASKWFDFEENTLKLKAVANLKLIETKEPFIEIRVFNIKNGEENKSPAFSGYLKNGSNAINDESILHLEAVKRKPTISENDFYKYHLFHGKSFKGIHKIKFWNNTGVVAEFKMPDLSKALKDNTSPDFIIPGPLLDSTGQLMAYWLYELGFKNYAIFPFQLEKFEQYQQFPGPGNVIICMAQIFKASSIVKGSFEFKDLNGNLLGRLINFSTRFFENAWVPHLLMNDFNDIDANALGTEFLYAGGGIWRKILAKIKLNEREYKIWQQKSENEQIDSLLNNFVEV